MIIVAEKYDKKGFNANLTKLDFGTENNFYAILNLSSFDSMKKRSK